MEENRLLFHAEDLSKSYDSTRALQHVSFSVNKGEIVCLVGENGAGKSTLLKLMMGVEKPDEGTMQIHGKDFSPNNPKEANAMGVGMVFQEQSLIMNLTVAQNIFFGDEKQFTTAGIINWGKMEKEAEKILEDLELSDINVKSKISDIQFSRRQMIEIAKVINRATKNSDGDAIILLDEPTSVLNGEEIERLFDEARKLKEKGNGVVFISHRLDEVLSIADRVYVFKDGQNVAMINREDANEDILYEKMVGKSSSDEFYRVNKQTMPKDEILVEAKDLGLYGFFQGINLTLHAGEIIGICGVVGSGKEHLSGVIGGDEPYTSGEMTVKGGAVKFNAPNHALKKGICSVPTERRFEGQVGIAPIRDNITYSSIDQLTKFGLINRKKEDELVEKWIKDLSIKCVGGKQPIENLSGGNAQKVVFARVLSGDVKIVILNHPTRGVDVGAKEEIYEIIRNVTNQGIGIILLGDTLDECIGLSNKLLVMKDGLVTKELDAPPENKPTQMDIIKHMM